MSGSDRPLDLLVVGAGPTGIAIGAEARRAGLDFLLLDRGPLAANLLDFPTDMIFFTTRDKLEIAGVPLALPHDKPTRQEALAYYAAVAARYELPLALWEEVTAVERRRDGLFEVATRSRRSDGAAGGERVRRARAVALATGYFHHPRRLGVAGEDKPWVASRYRDPYRHFGERVVVVGGGNSAVEAALDLWRHHARVTLVHRGAAVKPTVKYWLAPDFVNRVEEGAIAALFSTVVASFGGSAVEIEGPAGRGALAAEAAYVLIGYEVDWRLEAAAGVEVDAETLVPTFDPATCETNVPGLYVAGTLQAGRDTGRIFIENSRAHGPRIVAHVAAARARRRGTRPA